MKETRSRGCPDPRDLFLRFLGLADEEIAGEVDRHIRTCASCAAALAAFPGSEGDMSLLAPIRGHLPERVLAQRARAKLAVPAATTRAIEEHLVACESCRAELARIERLRGTPVAAELHTDALGITALEVEEMIAGNEGVIDERGGAGRLRAVTRNRGRSILPWLGGYAALATAAAIVFALREPLTQAPAPSVTVPVAPAPTPPPPALEPAPTSITTRTPAEIPETGPRAERPAWRVAVVPRDPRTLMPQTRAGGGSPDVRRGDEPGVLIVRIEVGLPGLQDDTPVVVELRNAAGTVLAHTHAPFGGFYGGATVVLSSGSKSLPAGDYRLRVHPDVPGNTDEVIYPFELPE